MVVVSQVYCSTISKAQSEANPSCLILVAAILAVPRTVEHSCTARRQNTSPTETGGSSGIFGEDILPETTDDLTTSSLVRRKKPIYLRQAERVPVESTHPEGRHSVEGHAVLKLRLGELSLLLGGSGSEKGEIQFESIRLRAVVFIHFTGRQRQWTYRDADSGLRWWSLSLLHA